MEVRFIYIAPQLPHMSPQRAFIVTERYGVPPIPQSKPAAMDFDLQLYSRT